MTDDLYDSRGFWPEKLVGYRSGEAVASSIDSKYLVSYSSSESQLRLTKSQPNGGGSSVKKIDIFGVPSCLFFREDGRFFGTLLDDGMMYIWETATCALAAQTYISIPNDVPVQILFSHESIFIAANEKITRIKIDSSPEAEILRRVVDEFEPFSFKAILTHDQLQIDSPSSFCFMFTKSKDDSILISWVGGGKILFSRFESDTPALTQIFHLPTEGACYARFDDSETRLVAFCSVQDDAPYHILNTGAYEEIMAFLKYSINIKQCLLLIAIHNAYELGVTMKISQRDLRENFSSLPHALRNYLVVTSLVKI